MEGAILNKISFKDLICLNTQLSKRIGGMSE